LEGTFRVRQFCKEDNDVLTYANKYQLSLTNPRNALHHSQRAANKGGRSM